MICKIVLPGDEIHRLPTLPKSYEDLEQTVIGKFKSKLPFSFDLHYKDTDDDLVNLSGDEDYKTALASISQLKGQTLRIFVSRSKPLNFPKSNNEPKQINMPFSAGNQVFEEIQMVSSQTFSAPPRMKEVDKENPVVIDNIPMSESFVLEKNLNEKKAEEEQPEQILKEDDSNLDNNQKVTTEMAVPEEQLKPTTAANTKFDSTTEEVTTTAANSHSDKLLFTPEQIQFIKELINEAFQSKNISEPKASSSSPKSNKFPYFSAFVGAQPKLEESKKNDGIQGSMYFKSVEKPHVVHEYICDGCQMHPIIGVRYRCTVCNNFDYCENCEKTLEHAHPFIKIKDLNQQKIIEKLPLEHPSPSLFNQIKDSGIKCIKDILPNKMTMSYLKEDSSKKYYKAKVSKEPPNPISNVEPTKPYNVIFALKNNGSVTWPNNTKLICIEGIHKGIEEKIPSLEPDKEIEINLPLQAPAQDGKHSSGWKLSYIDPEDKGVKHFGPKLTFEVKVEAKRDLGKSGIKLDAMGKMSSNLIQSNPYNVEYKCPPEVLEKANLLYDMFGGDLKDHIEFVRACKRDISVEEVVEIFLSRMQNNRRNSLSKSLQKLGN